MSKYITVGVGQMTEEQVIEALTTDKEKGGMGIPRKHIIVQKDRHLEGFMGDKRDETADITIPRRYLNGSANDIGFKQKDNGTWDLIESEYDGGYYRDGTQTTRGGAQRHFRGRFTRSATINRAKRQMRKSKLGRNWQYKGIVKKVGTKVFVEIEER